MAIWTWSGKSWERCCWYRENTRIPAAIYGSGMSASETDTGTRFRFVMNAAHAVVEPHVWTALDRPGQCRRSFNAKTLDTPWRKVFNGAYASDSVDGIRVREFPETYFADTAKLKREDIFSDSGPDTRFIWAGNTLVFTLHLMLHMGFNDIEFAGIDLCGDYFYGKKSSARDNRLFAEQLQFMRWFSGACAEAGVKLSCPSPKSLLSGVVGLTAATVEVY